LTSQHPVTAQAPPARPLVHGPDLPTLSDLEAATATTAAVLADPAATAANRIVAAEAEEATEATLLAYARRPEAEAVLQAGHTGHQRHCPHQCNDSHWYALLVSAEHDGTASYSTRPF
jgi:hypothetical protein